MSKRSGSQPEPTDASTRGAEEAGRSPNDDGIDGLRMAPELMLDLARKAAELVVERTESLPGENAWDGEFRQELAGRLLENAPEEARPPMEVIEQAAREILPVATRLDQPRCFGFVPSSPTWPGVLADFMAAGYHINECTWLVASGPSQVELVVIDWFRRWVGYPESAGGLFTSGASAASVDASPQDVFAQALHRQLHHDLGRRARDAGGCRAVREGCVVGGIGARIDELKVHAPGSFETYWREDTRQRRDARKEIA